jgi:hypothetical protein
MNGNFVSLPYACEESIVDYFIATLDPLQLTASYYTGIGNVEDLQAPAVFVQCDNGTETFHKSNVYDMTVNINVKEMAADTTGSNLGVLTATIYNLVCDPSMSLKLNTNNQRNFSSLFVQKLENRHTVNKDALISDTVIRVIGCLSGSI